MSSLNILFICSRNQWRSPTGERIWARRDGIMTRSAGTSPRANRVVSYEDIQWADVIFLMEDKHLSRIRAQFCNAIKYKEIHVLHIPDEYKFMDQELIELLCDSVEPILSAHRIPQA